MDRFDNLPGWADISLGPEDAVHRSLAEEDLGDAASDTQAEFRRMRIRISQVPVPQSLRKLYALREEKLPPEMQVLLDSYEPWLIRHVVQVIDEGSFAEVLQVGYSMRFLDPNGVTVQGLLPATEFITHMGASASGEVSARVALSGVLSMGGGEDQGEVASLSGAASFKPSAEVGITGSIAFSLATPEVLTTGVGSNESTWIFARRARPLLGDLQMFQTVLIPKHHTHLSFEAKVFVVVAPWPFFRKRLEPQAPTRIECVLQ